MKKEKKKGRGMWAFIYVTAFIVVFAGSAIFKMTYKSEWSKKYTVDWNDSVGKVYSDLSYGDGEANKFDLYVPADSSKGNYGLVVYLHAGGFTSGDKSGDAGMLEWLCSKGYVACGINYTLRTDENNASVLTQSNEIKTAMPVVVEEAKKLGYNITEMTVSGGSAGGCLAMLYAYRDAAESPVPVKLMFEMVGPSSFYAEDWGIYGLDKSPEAAASLFGVMGGIKLTPEMITSDAYVEPMKPVSALAWVSESSCPSVLLYGTRDKVQPFAAVHRLTEALQDNGIDYKCFEAPHSGHGVQNDDKIFEQYMETVVEYLVRYMPVK